MDPTIASLGLAALQNPASLNAMGATATSLANVASGLVGGLLGRPTAQVAYQPAAIPPAAAQYVTAAAVNAGQPIGVTPTPQGGSQVTVSKGFFDGLFSSDGEDDKGKTIMLIGLAGVALLLLQKSKSR